MSKKYRVNQKISMYAAFFHGNKYSKEEIMNSFEEVEEKEIEGLSELYGGKLNKNEALRKKVNELCNAVNELRRREK